MRASATGLKSSQVTLKLPTADSGQTLQAAGAATLKLPPNGTAKRSSVMTLRPHTTISIADVETLWDPPKALTEHGKKFVELKKGVDHMSAAFKDSTAAKAEKRRMMDEMHETALERVEVTRKDIEALLVELGVYLGSFKSEYAQKLKTTFEELQTLEVERIAAINDRFQRLEERQQALHDAIEEETATRIAEAEAILEPARRSVESLVDDLEQERQLRRARNEELKQKLEDAATMLTDVIETEQKTREDDGCQQLIEKSKVDIQRLKDRSEKIEQSNASHVVSLQEDINAEEHHRKETQDQTVVKITNFIHRFQKHIKEEGEMGC